MRSSFLALLALALSTSAFAQTPCNQHEPVGAVIKNRLTQEHLFMRCNANSADCSRMDMVIASKVNGAYVIARVLDTDLDRSMMASSDEIGDAARSEYAVEGEIDLKSLAKKVWALKNKKAKMVTGKNSAGEMVEVEVELSKAVKTLRWATSIVGFVPAKIADYARYGAVATGRGYKKGRGFLADRRATRGYSRLDLEQFKGKTIKVSNKIFNQIVDNY